MEQIDYILILMFFLMVSSMIFESLPLSIAAYINMLYLLIVWDKVKKRKS